MMFEKRRSSSNETRNSDTLPFVLAEYNALREEILKHTEIQHQFISLALIAPGTILAFGLQAKNAALILLYPALAMFLSIAWASQDRGNRIIGAYIRTRIESKIGEDLIGWEHFLVANRNKFKRPSLNFLASRGIFIGTEILAILVGISIAVFNNTVILLLVIDIASIVITIIFLRRVPIKGLPGKTDLDIFVPTTGVKREQEKH
jgi:hypothetical protein